MSSTVNASSARRCRSSTKDDSDTRKARKKRSDRPERALAIKKSFTAYVTVNPSGKGRGAGRAGGRGGADTKRPSPEKALANAASLAAISASARQASPIAATG